MKRKVLAGLLTVVMAAGFVAVPGMQTEVKADDKKLVGVAMPTKDLQRWNQDGENRRNLWKMPAMKWIFSMLLMRLLLRYLRLKI